MAFIKLIVLWTTYYWYRCRDRRTTLNGKSYDPDPYRKVGESFWRSAWVEPPCGRVVVELWIRVESIGRRRFCPVGQISTPSLVVQQSRSRHPFVLSYLETTTKREPLKWVWFTGDGNNRKRPGQDSTINLLGIGVVGKRLNSVVKSRIRWPLKAALSPGVQPTDESWNSWLLLALDSLLFLLI